MKILIIDSDKKLTKAINREIDTDQFEVCYAADGKMGQKVAQGKKFDIVLVGCVLPEKNSLSTLNDLRAQSNKIPIMVAIENYSLENIILLINSGANACVAKTSASKVIIARMHALIRRTAWDRSAEIIYDRIRLDPVTHKVWNCNKEIQLTSKEYSLLFYFIKNTGQVVTRSMIAENVWDCAINTFTNIIDVYVTYLRRKIDLGANNKLIHTVRGAGYVFSETF
jgi:DNA-binding response OmpR family regulator